MALAITGCANDPSPSTPASAALETYDGGGWAFEYPSSWRFYPFEIMASRFHTDGYLASVPVDTDAICEFTSTTTSCNFEGYDLPPGGIVIRLGGGGMPMTDPEQFYDRPEQGSRVIVGGMVAVFEKHAAANRVRMDWKIARPDAFGNWVEISADMTGPAGGALQREVEAMIGTFRFIPPPVALAEGDAAARAIALKAMTEILAIEPGAYDCYPTQPGESTSATVEALPSAHLKKPLPVRCSMSIRPTDIGFWRMELVAAWDSASDRTAGSQTTVLWLFPDGTLSSTTGSGGPPEAYCCRG